MGLEEVGGEGGVASADDDRLEATPDGPGDGGGDLVDVVGVDEDGLLVDAGGGEDGAHRVVPQVVGEVGIGGEGGDVGLGAREELVELAQVAGDVLFLVVAGAEASAAAREVRSKGRTRG